jgi:hypothetical protein
LVAIELSVQTHHERE